jgi:hypothetical protein
VRGVRPGGSLYAAVGSLERRGLVVPQQTVRAGRLPERTIERITDAGRVETHDWLTELVHAGERLSGIRAALSFLPGLPPDDLGPNGAGKTNLGHSHVLAGLCCPRRACVTGMLAARTARYPMRCWSRRPGGW